jgi:hypothetical protein
MSGSGRERADKVAGQELATGQKLKAAPQVSGGPVIFASDF